MSDPKRIQRKRTKGYRLPEGAVYVGRPARWGNPFKTTGPAAAFAAVASGGKGNDARAKAHGVCCLYVRWIGALPVECGLTGMMAGKELEEAGTPRRPSVAQIRAELRGKDLACFCPLTDADGTPFPCHADVLLEIANAPAEVAP